MEGLQVKTSPDELEEPRWSRVIILSLLFHMVIFSAILFVPDSIPTRRISGAAVYEVNLVEMPGKSRSISPKSSTSKMSRKVASSKKSAKAKRISRPTKKEKTRCNRKKSRKEEKGKEERG